MSDKLLEKARKWAKHFDENGNHNTIWHDIVRRHEAKTKKKTEGKEIKHGTQNIG